MPEGIFQTPQKYLRILTIYRLTVDITPVAQNAPQNPAAFLFAIGSLDHCHKPKVHLRLLSGLAFNAPHPPGPLALSTATDLFTDS